MNKAFYVRLSVSNLKKNQKMTLPFLFTSILSVMMFYMVTSLANNPDILKIQGGSDIQYMLRFGMYVVGLFCLIFLFYTQSFLTKRRKKEFGLFTVLGMEKRHINRVIGYEYLLFLIVSLIVGILAGILLDKAFVLWIGKLLSTTMPIGFSISDYAIKMSCLLFAGIYFLMFLFSWFQVQLSHPASLLKSEQAGEKEPKTRWILTLIGVVCLSTGYVLAVTIQDVLTTFLLFFVAVVLVIIGTYCLFTSVSIFVLKLLRKNKRYYYQTHHMINVSTMLYRMKQNAVGLANICILSTMVLVMLSTTICLWAGIDEAVDQGYPRDVMIEFPAHDVELALDQADAAVKEEGISSKNIMAYRCYSTTAFEKENIFYLENDGSYSLSDAHSLFFFCQEDYNRAMEEDIHLEPGNIMIYGNEGPYERPTFQIGNMELRVAGTLNDFMPQSEMGVDINSSWMIVLPSLKELEEVSSMAGGDIKAVYNFDTDQEVDSTIATNLSRSIQEKQAGDWCLTGLKKDHYQHMVSLYAGFLFIGIFLSFLFIMATVLIMYYKQITEGQQDQKRFTIMKNIGLEEKEIKKAINSQVLTVFFLPLAVAGVHIAFAFPMIKKLLLLLYMDNENLFVVTTILCFLAFSFVYSVVYRLTSKVYYHIIQANKK